MLRISSILSRLIIDRKIRRIRRAYDRFERAYRRYTAFVTFWAIAFTIAVFGIIIWEIGIALSLNNMISLVELNVFAKIGIIVAMIAIAFILGVFVALYCLRRD